MKQKLLSILLMSLFACSIAMAQTKTITGKVTDADSKSSLPGVTVKVKNASTGTQTDQNGNFVINVPPGSTLSFSFVGYKPLDVQIGDKTILNVSLLSDMSQLAEVVVTGYQSKIRTDLTSSVSTIMAKEIADKPVPTVDNLLQGKAAGVQVFAQNGKPGANAYIRIRGVGSVNAGQQPLLVVDGTQVPDREAPQFYSTLNANDIQSVTVLKDAAAVSLYGARGSNGVIYITTKTGAESSSHISYDFQYGLNTKIPDNYKMMDAAQKLQYEYDLGYQNPYFTDYLQNNDFPSTATLFNITPTQRQTGWNTLIAKSHNWLDDIFHRGAVVQHQITISGHENKTNYYVSFEKFTEDGIADASTFNRYEGKVNLSTEVKPWFTLSNNLALGQKSTDELRDIYNAQNPFVAAYVYNAYEPIYNADGSYNTTTQGFPILEALKDNRENQKFLDGYNNTTLDIHPIKGLNFGSQLGLTYDDYKRSLFDTPESILESYIGDPTALGEKEDNGSTEFGLDWINKATYKFQVASDHHFGLLAVQEFQKDQFTTYDLQKKGFATETLDTQDNGAANTGNNTTTLTQWAIASILGELDYNYKEKYFLTGTFRRDGSSRFGTNEKYGNFYSVGASWLINQEDFMKDVTWINVLKLRASIGTSGNFSGIGDYQSLGLYGFGRYNDQLTEKPNQVANPDLTWEQKLKRNIGVDFEVLHSRISGSIEYYNESTSDLLFAVPVSQTTGVTSVINGILTSAIFKNVGALYNRGFDISLNADLVRTNKLKWSIYGNANFNTNKVTKLYSGANEIDDQNGLTTVKPGYAINTFKMVRYAGVNTQTGAPQYYDKNGKITETYSGDDAVVLNGKSTNPKSFGGFGTDVTYTGFELSADLTYTWGNYAFNGNKSTLDAWGDEVVANQAVDALDYWKKPGDKTLLPKASQSNITYNTDLYLQNASYIRLRNVTLAYTLPKEFTQKYKVRSLRFFITAQNLFTINPYHFFGDPEVGIGSAEGLTTIPGQATLFSYPTTRQFAAGANITF